MRRALPTLLMVVGLVSGACGQQDHFWGEELGPIFDVLALDHSSAFLELSQEYDPMRLPRLPQFRTVRASKTSPLRNLGKIVARNSGMRVSKSANGTFVIRQKGVPTDVLNIRISHLTFKDFCFQDIYSASSALRIILDTPEVFAYAASHHISFGGRANGIGRGVGCGLPPPGPHFSASLDKVTVGQALETVLKEFPGEILVYWNFPKANQETRTADDTSQHPRRQPLLPNFYSECRRRSSQDGVSRTPSPLLPDPLCLPPAAFPAAFPGWLLMQLEPSRPDQRAVFFQFFSRKPFGDKRLITGG